MNHNDKLIEYLSKCARAYYMGEPIIDDDTFDRLSELCGFNDIGSKPSGDTARHMFQMFSLQKYYEDEGTRPDLQTKDIDISPKLDGAAGSLLYNANGELVQGLTRGDGVEGKLITDKLYSTNSLVPHKINYDKVIQVVGEFVAPSNIENARNYAAGSLNLKDLNEFRTRAISFFAYGIEPFQKKTFYQDMELLTTLGFSTVKLENLHKIYPCDGLVYRVNDNEMFKSLGYTAKHPRGAYALKERGEAIETRLLDVEWQVGKSGKITPIAILEPINIGGAVIRKATLNNIGFIRTLDLCIGDTVGVIRSGEVIPKIVYKSAG